MSNDEKIKVVLTAARPVRIDPEKWPVIAEAKRDWFDGQYDFQANRTRDYKLKVRQHANGCALVYGTYKYVTTFEDEEGIELRAGRRLAPGDDVVAAILAVAADLESEVEDSWFRRLGNDCVADLPAIDLECTAPVAPAIQSPDAH